MTSLSSRPRSLFLRRGLAFVYGLAGACAIAAVVYVLAWALPIIVMAFQE